MADERRIAWERIGLVLLGAGRSARFGRDKLSALLLGEPLIRRTAAVYAAEPFARRVAVLGQGAVGLADMGFAEVRVGAGLAQSDSLRAGVGQLATGNIDAILVALADMPLVTRAHLEQLRMAFSDDRPVCSATDSARCPPALFPIWHSDRLMAQQGDRGARSLLNDAVAIRAEADTLLDVDTEEQLARAEMFARQQRVN